MNHELVLELAAVSRQFGAVRGAAQRQLRLSRRRGARSSVRTARASRRCWASRRGSSSLTRNDQDRRQEPESDSPALSRKLGLAMAYQDGSSVLAEPVKNNLYYAAASGRPPYRRRKKWASGARRFRPRLGTVPGRAGRHADHGRAPAVRGGQGTVERAEGVAARRTRPPSAPMRSRRSTAPSWRASGGASASSTSAIGCRKSSRSQTGSPCSATASTKGPFGAAKTTEPHSSNASSAAHSKRCFHHVFRHHRRPTRCSWSMPCRTIVRSGQFHVAQRRGRRDRRGGRQRSVATLRLAGGTHTSRRAGRVAPGRS